MGKTTKNVYTKDNPMPPEMAEEISIIFIGNSRNPSKDDSEKPKEEIEVREERKEQSDAGGEK